jgi:hypothetical protein
MTTREEVLAYFQKADPTELREVLAKVADAFSEKAEALYDKNPEENGLLAQPYADIADLVGEASMVFEGQAPPPVDVSPSSSQTPPVPTVSQVVAARKVKVTGNPWGNR